MTTPARMRHAGVGGGGGGVEEHEAGGDCKQKAISDPLPVLFLKGREEKRRAGDNGGGASLPLRT